MLAVPTRLCWRTLLQLEEMRKNEDPRLSFATPEFKDAQRTFTENFKVCSSEEPGWLKRVLRGDAGGRKGRSVEGV